MYDMGIFDVDENIEAIQPLPVKVFKLLEIIKEGYIQGRWIDVRDDPEKYQGPYYNWLYRIKHPDFDDVWIEIKGMDSTKSLPSRYGYKWERYVGKEFHTYMKELGVVKAYRNRYIPEDISIIKKEDGITSGCSKLLMCDVMLYDKELFDGRNFKKHIIDIVMNDRFWHSRSEQNHKWTYIEMFPGLFYEKY